MGGLWLGLLLGLRCGFITGVRCKGVGLLQELRGVKVWIRVRVQVRVCVVLRCGLELGFRFGFVTGARFYGVSLSQELGLRLV